MARWITKVLVVLRRVVVWGVLTFLGLIVITLTINARDERLSSEAQALLQLPRNPYLPQENIYVALAGFDAPARQSVVATGQARIAHYNGQVDAMLQDPLYPLRDLSRQDPLALKFNGKTEFGLPREPSFWASVRENGPKVVQLARENRELYERYLAMQKLPGYFETQRASVMANIFAPPTELRNLFLAKFALTMQKGDDTQKQTALTGLCQDINLWRRMLAGEGNLISKMLAIAYLQNDYLVLSDMIADPDTAIPDNIDSFLPNPDTREWNIGKAFGSEFRFHSFIYLQTQTLGAADWQPPGNADSRVRHWFNRVILNPIGERLFKLNATENLDAKLMNQLAGFAAINPATFAAERARYRKWADDNAHFLRLRTVYNPTGKILVAIAAPAYEQYVLRPYDTAALQRLVRLSLEIRRHLVAPSGMTAFMTKHREWSTHPADGRSFSWNPTTGEIAILTVAKQPSDRRFSVQIWRKPAS